MTSHSRFDLYLFTLVTCVVLSCAPGVDSQQADSAVGQAPDPGTSRELNVVTAQTVFVPAYTELRRGRDTVGLHTTVAIHNADVEFAIVVQSVRYYDTNGTFVKEYVDQPTELGPLGTLLFAAAPTSRGKGIGANFVVQWGAEAPVHEPVIEAVMVGATGSYSLISLGRVMSERKR